MTTPITSGPSARIRELEAALADTRDNLNEATKDAEVWCAKYQTSEAALAKAEGNFNV